MHGVCCCGRASGFRGEHGLQLERMKSVEPKPAIMIPCHKSFALAPSNYHGLTLFIKCYLNQLAFLTGTRP